MSTDTQTLPAVVVDNGPMSLALVGQRVDYIDQMKREIMKEGRDYMVIPGTKKPSLVKPGAEKLAAAFILAPTYTTTDQTERFHEEWNYESPVFKWQNEKKVQTGTETKGTVGFYSYRVSCELRHRETGQVWASAEGVMNSRERGRETAPSNTILKMAQKRAFIAAVLNATFSSELFTQDMEDYPRGGNGSGSASKPAPAGQTAPQQQQSTGGVWPVGKHKGTPIADLDPDYLQWVLKNMDKQDLRDIASAELARRNGGATEPPDSSDCDPPADNPNKELIEQIEAAEVQVWGADTATIRKNRIANAGTIDLTQLGTAGLETLKQSVVDQMGA